MDQIGINQHHDAITGTAKQFVADDYALRVFKALQGNNPVYAKQIESYAEKIGISASAAANQSWEWCLRSNSSYLDCPVAK